MQSHAANRTPSRRTGLTGRISYVVLGQVLSSVSNFVLSVLAARASTAAAFGGFSVAITIYYFTIELLRPVACDPIMIRYSAGSDRHASSAVSQAVALAAGMGLVAGGVTVAASQVSTHALRWPLIAMGAMLPGLFVQDVCRYGLIARQRANLAAASDGLWLTLQLTFSTLLFLRDALTTTTAILAWGIAGALSAAVGLMRFRVVPRRMAPMAYLRRHKDLAGRFGLEYLLDAGAFQAAMITVGVVGGLVAVGALNGARVVMGPLGVLFISAMSLMTSEGARARSMGRRNVVKVFRMSAVGMSIVALLYSAVLTAVPVGIGEVLLGDTFSEAQPVMIAMGIFFATKGVINSARAGLRVAELAQDSLRTMAIVAPITIAGALIGAVLDASIGAAWGLAIGNTVAALVWWRVLEARRRWLVETDGLSTIDRR